MNTQQELSKTVFFSSRVTSVQPIFTPEEAAAEYPVSDCTKQFIASSRKTVSAILAGNDRRLLVFSGPCSIHDDSAALDYAKRLSALQKKYEKTMFFVMRAHFEKPRTAHGWRGLIMQPNLTGCCDMQTGLRRTRRLLQQIAEIVPASSELLDPAVPQYIADLLTFAVIGARSTESQIHRALASGLSMPTGFKNPRDGDIQTVLNALESAREPHAFIGITPQGTAASIQTAGNPDTHVILRGSKARPNYDKASITAVTHEIHTRKIKTAIIVDCSHDNSLRDIHKQADIFLNTVRLKSDGISDIRGIMLESFIQEGSVDAAVCTHPTEYGKSITDPCISWQTTTDILAAAHTHLQQKPLQKKESSSMLAIYTDGACSGNPGPGGWAFVIIDTSCAPEKKIHQASGYEKNTTNNRMELTAVIRALDYVRHLSEKKVVVYTDSQYVKKGISEWIHGWKKNGWKNARKEPVKNQDLWKTLDTYTQSMDISWQWLKGHAGNKWNELCDTQAVAQIKNHSHIH